MPKPTKRKSPKRPPKTKAPTKGPRMLAPLLVSSRTAAFVAAAAKRRGLSSAAFLREAIDTSEQIQAGNVRVMIERRESYDDLQRKQGRQ